MNRKVITGCAGIRRKRRDIDVVLVQGYGFPRWEGGPVFWARRQDRVAMETELDQMIRAGGHGAVRANSQQLDQLLVV